MLKRRNSADPTPTAPLSNGGPPLDDSPRPWGDNGIGNYFEWKAVSEKAFNDVPYDIAVMRARRAEAIPVRSGPGAGYRTIDTLPSGSEVRLQRCTRNSNWCLFLDDDGEPAGWVRGSYLVGSGAKLEVTPYKFEGFDPLDPIDTCDDDDDTSIFCW